MILSHIVAIGKNNVIGKANQLPWHLPADMKYFRETTKNHVVIMGRKNFEAEEKPLHDRVNIILSRQKEFHIPGCFVVKHIEDALKIAAKYEKDETFIIGGGEIYKLTLPHVQKIYITKIDIEIEGDVYYPDIDYNNWRLVSKRLYQKDHLNRYDHTYFIYEKIHKL